jgi:hypothetical protein
VSLGEAKVYHWAGTNTNEVQGPVGKLELQRGSQMLHCSRHLTVSVGIVLLALVAAAPLAFGQSTPVTYKTDVQVSNQVTTNQCSSAGEPVSLNGNMHTEMTFTTDSSGVNHFSIAVSSNLTGVGQSSGLSYTVQDSNNYNINSSDAGDMTVEFRSDLTPVAPGSVMMLIQTLHLSADTSGNIGLEVTSNTTQCGS